MSVIPVLAGPAYVERIQQLPSEFTATLVAEPGNVYHQRALAVHAETGKIGYVPPEIGRHYFASVLSRTEQGQATECPARKAPSSSAWTGVLVLLDFTSLGIEPEP